MYLRVGLFDVEADYVVYDFSLFRRVVDQQVACRRHHRIHVKPVKSVELIGKVYYFCFTIRKTFKGQHTSS